MTGGSKLQLSGIYIPDHLQNLINFSAVYNVPIPQISRKSTNNFLRYTANKHTNGGEHSRPTPVRLNIILSRNACFSNVSYFQKCEPTVFSISWA